MQDSNTHPRRRRLPRILSIIILAFACVFGIHACAMQRQIRREIDETERNPLTGVVLGTEARTLQPDKPTTVSMAVLMLHGFLGSRMDFADLGEELAADGFTVREVRLPGHGSTPVEFQWQPFDAILRAARVEFDRLKDSHDRVVLVGFSMGGALGTILSAENAPDGLVLLAPYFAVKHEWYYLLPTEFWVGTLGHLVSYVKRTEMFIKINKRENVGKYYMYRTVPLRGTRQLIHYGRLARRTETLAAVDCPVLVLHARGDEAASPGASRKAFEEMSSTDKEFIWLEKSNHVLLWDYEAEICKREIRRFLRELRVSQLADSSG